MEGFNTKPDRCFFDFYQDPYDLAKEKDKKILNAEGYAFISSPNENKRLKTIFNYIRDHFMEPIALEDISNQVFMTPQSFCRFFKKAPTRPLLLSNEYRIKPRHQIAFRNRCRHQNDLL